MSCCTRNEIAREILLEDLRNRLREQRLVDTIEVLERTRIYRPCASRFETWTPPCARWPCPPPFDRVPIEWVVSIRPRPSLC